MSIAARLRLVLARSPWLYWAIVAALAGAAGLFVMRAADGVDAARESWGETRRCSSPATTRARRPLDGGGAASAQLPSPMVPPTPSPTAPGAVARQHIAAGEVIVAHDVAPDAAPQSLIPDGWLAVAVAEPVASGARVGDAGHRGHRRRRGRQPTASSSASR